MTDDVSVKLRERILVFYRDLASGRYGANQPRSENFSLIFWDEMYSLLEQLHGENFSGRSVGRYVKTQAEANAGIKTIDARRKARRFLTRCSSNDFIDFIESSFKSRVMYVIILENANQVVDGVNKIFRAESTSYELTPVIMVNGEITNFPIIVRIEDELTYQEAVKPALGVLAAPHFEAANKEYREAMNHYRNGEYEDCLTKCGSAFESVLKVLCKRKGWKHGEHDTTGTLLTVVFDKVTLEPFFEQPIMLIATMRNRLSSSHGGGGSVRKVERHIAQYGITSTAAAIVLLVHEIGV